MAENSIDEPKRIEGKKLSPAIHREQDWECQNWTPDFEIEDVWQFPVEMESKHTFSEFHEVFGNALAETQTKGFAGVLFSIRTSIGKLFGWDKEPNNPELLPEKSLRKRYADAHGFEGKDLLPPGTEAFKPVYQLENESFSEIENSTVHAGIHLGKVPIGNGKFTVHLTVYNQPKGGFGRIYMAAISPFRLWIVYPSMLKLVGKAWKKHLLAKG